MTKRLNSSFALSAAVLVLFIAGFFIFFGREAASSGSWKYVITHLDGFQYWGMADGASENPSSEANPFYYEERGQSNSFPYPWVSFTGKLARALNLPVLAFMPIWQIFMPFLLWFVSTLSISRLLQKEFNQTGLFVLGVMILTLFLRGAASFILFRYTRPIDGLVLLIPWLCALTAHDRLKTNRKQTLLLIPFVLIWFHPIYILPGLCVLLGELCFSLWITKNRENISFWLRQISFIALAVLLYGLYVWLNSGENNWLIQHIYHDRNHALENSMSGSTASRMPHWLSIMFYLGVCFCILKNRNFKLTSLEIRDRLLIWMLALDPLLANVQILLGANYQAELHRYYFLIPQLLILFYWIYTEAAKPLHKKDYLLGILTLGAVTALSITPSWNFIMHFKMNTPFAFSFDQSKLLLGLSLIALLFSLGSHVTRNQFKRPLKVPVITTILILIGILGFALRPSEMRASNRDYPFKKAHQWLNHNAAAQEVVLNLSPARRWHQDYLIFYTPLRNYYHPYFGHVHSENKENNDYRSIFYNLLLLGWLDKMSIGELTTLEDKITYLKLDYILTVKPSPFISRVERQLGKYAERVYEDERSLIWKITIQS